MSDRILVVDDNPVNLRMLADWLGSEHYVVSTATDGFEALAKIAAERPDTVLLDVVMPELNGFEVCRRIKADPTTVDIPVIMVTALSDVDDLVRGFNAGADDFVTKPFNFDALTARVRSQLRRKRHYERIVEESLVDPLTCAFNRRYFDAHAPRLAARCRAARNPVAVLKIRARNILRGLVRRVTTRVRWLRRSLRAIGTGRFGSLLTLVGLAPPIFIDDIKERHTADWPEAANGVADRQ
jgi:PleD family two-component response regulator